MAYRVVEGHDRLSIDPARGEKSYGRVQRDFLPSLVASCFPSRGTIGSWYKEARQHQFSLVVPCQDSSARHRPLVMYRRCALAGFHDASFLESFSRASITFVATCLTGRQSLFPLHCGVYGYISDRRIGRGGDAQGRMEENKIHKKAALTTDWHLLRHA